MIPCARAALVRHAWTASVRVGSLSVCAHAASPPLTVARRFLQARGSNSSGATRKTDTDAETAQSKASTSDASASASAASSTSRGSKRRGGSGSGSGSSGGQAAPRVTLTWDALVRMDPPTQATVLESLPFFRHSICGVETPSWQGSSEPCEGRVYKVSGGARLRSAMVHIKAMMLLAQYVQVSTSPGDMKVGAREAFVLLADLFNSFHLAASRRRLRELVSTRVYRAVEMSWNEMDKLGLRMQYKVRVEDTVLADVHVHDSDAWGEGGKGGGGGPRIAVPAPLGAAPSTPSGSAFKGGMDSVTAGGEAILQSSEQGQKASPASSSASSSSSSKPNVLGSSKHTEARTVRYADADVLFSLSETLELWSTRTDQTKAAAEAGAAKPAGTAEGDILAQADNAAYEMISSLATAQAFIDKFDALVHPHDATPAASAEASTDFAKSMQQKVADADNSEAAFKPVEPAAKTEAEEGKEAAETTTATPAATPAAAATAAASSPSSSASPSSSSLPADGDWPAPLTLLSTVSGVSERGLRFTTSLPALQTRYQDDPLLWVDPAVPDPDEYWRDVFDTAVRVLRRFGGPAFQGSPQQMQNKPKAQWSIKDILD